MKQLYTFIISFMVIGCTLVQPSPPTHLYTLTALAQLNEGLQTISTPGVAIGVGPVELPEYVDRPQIMTGDGGNELRRSEFDQWAEPLGTNFTRILAINLSTLLKTERVAVFPWKGPVPLDYQIVVEVTQFLGNLNGSVSLVARWRILGKNGREALLSRLSSFTELTISNDYHTLVATMSHMVALLSDDIATAIILREGMGAHTQTHKKMSEP